MTDFDPSLFPVSDPTSVFRYRDRLYAVDLLGAAIVEFDFFTWLNDQTAVSGGDICAHFGFAPRPVDVMVTLFVANGYLERVGDEIQLTDQAREFLVKGSPWYMGPYYDSLSERPVLKDMVKVLKSGKPTNWGSSDSEQDDWHAAMEREDFAEMFTAAMDCRGLFLGQHLARQLKLGPRKHVLDIGGGSGIYACVLAEMNPGLRATVLEKSPVDEIARKAILKRACQDRVEVAAGDMFTDPWPETDVHLFSNVLHDWEEPEVETLLRRSAQYLPAGGLVVIHDALLNEDKSGPIEVAEYSALLMNVTQGKCYAISEYRSLLERIGFGQVTAESTAADRGFMTAIKI